MTDIKPKTKYADYTEWSEALMADFQRWERQRMSSAPIGKQVIDPTKIEFIYSELVIDPPNIVEGAFTITCGYNHKLGSIDTAILFQGERTRNFEVAVFAAVFDGHSFEDELARLTIEEAKSICPKIVEYLNEVLKPHLEFLLDIRLYQVKLPTEFPGSSEAHSIVGSMAIPN